MLNPDLLRTHHRSSSETFQCVIPFPILSCGRSGGTHRTQSADTISPFSSSGASPNNALEEILQKEGKLADARHLNFVKAETFPAAIREILIASLSRDKEKTQGFERLRADPRYMEAVFEREDYGEIVRAIEALPMTTELKWKLWDNCKLVAAASSERKTATHVGDNAASRPASMGATSLPTYNPAAGQFTNNPNAAMPSTVDGVGVNNSIIDFIMNRPNNRTKTVEFWLPLFIVHCPVHGTVAVATGNAEKNTKSLLVSVSGLGYKRLEDTSVSCTTTFPPSRACYQYSQRFQATLEYRDIHATTPPLLIEMVPTPAARVVPVSNCCTPDCRLVPERTLTPTQTRKDLGLDLRRSTQDVVRVATQTSLFKTNVTAKLLEMLEGLGFPNVEIGATVDVDVGWTIENSLTATYTIPAGYWHRSELVDGQPDCFQKWWYTDEETSD